MRDIKEYENMLDDFKDEGVRIVKTEMEYGAKIVRFWIVVPRYCESIVSVFKTSVMSFYPDFEVVVKCKEES